jgi:asparagine synthase (glutamine-hydrolysing)
MCGIVAVISDILDTKNYCSKMLSAISHRGKDARNVITDGTVSLGHNRLAINDLSVSGEQPFKLYDGALIAYSVTNGEIWNHKEFEFNRKSNSDCEAVLHAYMTMKMKDLDGMFSIMILHNNLLHIFRDWVGKVPLFMVKETKSIFLCSEIKGIRAVTQNKNIKFIPKNSHVVIDVIDQTIIKIEENYFGKIGNNTNIIENFKGFSEKQNKIRVAQDTYQLLDRAVEKRIISDVPIATLNSGGMDSSVITYLLSQKIKNIKCYTVKFDENSPDLKHARILADFLKIELVEVEVPRDAEEIKKRFSIVNKCIEYPSSIQTQCGIMTSYLMERIAKDGAKVVFSGEGSDESAGSYSRMQMFKNKPDWCELKKELFEKQFRGNLLRGNNIGMYFGTIETRTPFFDRDYVEYVCNLPSCFTVGAKQQRKQHLADAFRGKIPDAIIDRPKETFQSGTCFQEWFENIIINDKVLNINGRKKLFHVIKDDINCQLNYDIDNSTEFKFEEDYKINDFFE